MSHPKLSPLPQEIVDLIIDQVAVLSSQDRKNTLRACSNVSRSFYRQSQRQLFSDIAFPIDDSSDRRAARLRKVLVSSPFLISSIYSLKLVFENPPATARAVPSRVNNIYHRSKRTLQRMGSKINLWKNHVAELLELFGQLPLRKLAFITSSETAPLYWSGCRHSRFEVELTKLIFRVTSNPAFQSLIFDGFVGIPTSFLAGKSQPNNLCVLELRHAYFVRSPLIPFALEGSSHFCRYLTNVTSLIMINQWHIQFFAFFPPGLPPSSLFPHLTSLVVSLPSGPANMNILLQFILGVSGALETLELHDTEYFGSSLELSQQNYLGQFSALRRLCFKFEASQSIAHLYTRLDFISNFLTSATSPVHISSIGIEILVDLGKIRRKHSLKMFWKRQSQDDSDNDDHDGEGQTTDSYESHWARMDTGLANPMFADLHTVNFGLALIQNDYFKGRTLGIKDLQPLFPKVYETPVQLILNVETIFRRIVIFPDILGPLPL